MPRARIPMEKREVEGTTRAKHKEKAKNAPKVPVVLIEECPGLTKIGLKHWPTVRTVLQKLPVTAESDMIAVQRLAEAYAQVREFNAVLEKEGRFYTSFTRDGSTIRSHPMVEQYEKAETRLRLLMNEFGLTPAARSKVSSDGGGDGKDPLATLGL